MRTASDREDVGDDGITPESRITEGLAAGAAGMVAMAAVKVAASGRGRAHDWSDAPPAAKVLKRVIEPASGRSVSRRHIGTLNNVMHVLYGPALGISFRLAQRWLPGGTAARAVAFSAVIWVGRLVVLPAAGRSKRGSPPRRSRSSLRAMSRNAATHLRRLMAKRTGWVERVPLREVQQAGDRRFDALARAASMRSVRLAIVGALTGAACRRYGSPIPLRQTFTAVVASHGSGAALRAAIGRRRPREHDERIEPGIEKRSSSSFPSTHAATAFAVAVVLGRALPEARLPLLVGASLVAASRVWLRVHHPTDVVAGAALGSLVGVAVANRHGRPRRG